MKEYDPLKEALQFEWQVKVVAFWTVLVGIAGMVVDRSLVGFIFGLVFGIVMAVIFRNGLGMGV